MVAIVCGPSKGDFGQVAGSYDNTIVLVGNIHQNLGPFTRLGVFIDSVMEFFRMLYILEMNPASLFDVNLLEAASHFLNQVYGIEISAGCRSESRHCYGKNILSVLAKLVEGADAYQ